MRNIWFYKIFQTIDEVLSLRGEIHRNCTSRTHKGLMEYSRLPFGMVTACATCIPLMRIVLAGLSDVVFYFDNMFIASKYWSGHLKAITEVLNRLRIHGLTAKPSK